MRPRNRQTVSTWLGILGAVAGLVGVLVGVQSCKLTRRLHVETLLDDARVVLDRSSDGWTGDSVFRSPEEERSVGRKIARLKDFAPRDPEILLVEGLYESVRGEPDAAIAAFERSIQVGGPDYDVARVYLASELATIGRVDEALARLDEVILANEDDELAVLMLTTRCYALWRDDDLEDSARACSQALDIDEDYIPAYVNYANAKLAANDVEAAARILDAARDVNPKAPGVLSNRAHVATLMGDFELATKLLDFALSLDPGNEVLLEQKRDLQRAQGGITEDGVLGSVADDLITVGGGQ